MKLTDETIPETGPLSAAQCMTLCAGCQRCCTYVAVEVDALVREARLFGRGVLTDGARAAGSAVGIDVVEVVVKDVILPPELRIAYAELVTTRTRGQAQLEAARAETAALRSLANGAKLLDDHPALARLRLVQSLPHGSTLELGLPER